MCVLVGPVSIRNQPPPDSSGNTIGLEAIIRKALMGNIDEQSCERSPSGSGPPAAAADAREEAYSLPGMDLEHTHTLLTLFLILISLVNGTCKLTCAMLIFPVPDLCVD